ncbi:MAG TPA: thioredoxin domain-containing protein [Rhizomicrobium sp.]|nr:thioredoxin domain-containing protein [Rhizomicrobium sp.]
MTANLAANLADSISPYLRLHKDNPVAWRVWSDAVLSEARETGKPIFLSIGYLGCHFCQVMNRESFSDPDTAQLLNDNFIPVLVDREERPDLDQIYQAAASVVGHSGGWPLNVFLTAEGVPYFLTGSLPKEDRMDQPSFRRVLTDMAAIFKDRPEEVARNVTGIQDQLNQLFNRDMQGGLDTIKMEMAALRIGQRFDVFMGGLIGTHKFPSVPLLEVLWRAYLRTGVPQYMQLVSTTLNNMLLGGLYDHVGGGFFRYTIDERWLVPHFEKSLCDNALLIGFMTELWQFNRNELCRGRVNETIDWLLREMKLEGAFACSQAPEAEGEEGRYYVWSEAEIDAALAGTFSARFKQVYGVKRDGDYNGKNILRRLGIAQPSEADEALMARQRAILLEARNKRVRPTRDDKLLADWNGFAIRALAFAGAAFDRADWIEAAATAFDGVVRLMEKDGVLYHAWADGKPGPKGFADDYVHMAEAALQLYEATGERRYVEKAKAWVGTLEANFWDTVRGGYYFTGHDAERLIIRIRMIFDQPVPSANAAMISLLTRLALITGEHGYGMKAQMVLQAFAGEFARSWASCGEFLNGFETFATGLQMVVVGPRTDPRTRELVRAIWGKSMPNRLLIQVEASEELPANHPAFGKPMENGQPTVYLCQRNNCSPPYTGAVSLSQVLTLPQQQAPAA